MLRTSQISMLLLVAAVFALPWSPALGDPLQGRDVLKFSQLPMVGTDINGTKYWGHDELSTAWAMTPGLPAGDPQEYAGTAMADDFADKFDTPVVHVKWWGSYINDQNSDFMKARKFLISFETDVPVDLNSGGTFNEFSHPGTPLLSQVVTLGPLAPGSGTFMETPLATPAGVEGIYEYNAELACPFPQEADTVYWLKIVALDDVADAANPLLWGWHNRDYTVFDPLASPAIAPGEYLDGTIVGSDGTDYPIWHFQDDSVSSSVFVTEPMPPNPDDPCDWYVQQDNYMPQNYVSPYDGPTEIFRYSKDLAFELYTVPEPSTFVLLGLGAAYLLTIRRRKLL